MPTEDERAQQYRTDQRKLQALGLARYQGLAGQASAYNTRLSETEALQRDSGWDPVDRLTEEERDALGN